MTSQKRFLRLPAVITVLGKSHTVIYRDIQSGTFPASIHIGACSVALNLVDLETWQQAKIDAAAAGTAGAKPRSQG